MFIGKIINYCNKINYVCYNSFIFWYRKVNVGKNVSIRGKINVYGDKGTLTICDNVIINSHISYNPIGGWSGCSFATSRGGNIIIKDGAGISNSAFCSMSNITIGERVYIGGGCRIYDTDFHSLDFDHRMKKNDTHIKTAPVTIKKGAFVGGGSIILKGVTVGERAVVGAGSVVTKDIPADEIWAGNPAKFIRKL